MKFNKRIFKLNSLRGALSATWNNMETSAILYFNMLNKKKKSLEFLNALFVNLHTRMLKKLLILYILINILLKIYIELKIHRNTMVMQN